MPLIASLSEHSFLPSICGSKTSPDFQRLILYRPVKSESSAGAGVAKEVVVRKHMVVITSPPNARYSPSGTIPTKRQLFAEVRALVIPVIPDRSGTKFPILPQV